MLNKEKYAKELVEIAIDENTVAIKDDKPVKCVEIHCIDCKRHNDKGICAKEKLLEWANSEYKEHILTEEEKAYLSAVIKPFRDEVRCIKKLNDDEWAEEYICICIKQSPSTNLPRFDEGMAYENMENGREYTLEELGL